MKTTMWMNIYRNGWFHRANKPRNCNLHGGDCYLSEELAKADIDPPSHYITTVSFEYEGEDVFTNPDDATPVPLSVSRKREPLVEIVMQAAGTDRATATAYLEAEEWDVEEALVSLRGDRKATSEFNQAAMSRLVDEALA